MSLGLEVVIVFSFSNFGGLRRIGGIFHLAQLLLIYPKLDGWFM